MALLGKQESRDQGKGEQEDLIGEEESRDQGKGKQEVLIGGEDPRDSEISKDIVALEDALEFSSQGPEKRVAILADIQSLLTSANSEGERVREAEADIFWPQLPELQGRPELPTFRK